MEFTTDSAIVQTWVRLIKNGDFTKEQIPTLGNLQEIVHTILEPEEEG